MKHVLITLVLAATPAFAAEDDAFVEFRSLKLEVAQRMAEVALAHCRDQGFQVGVTVVDKSGVPQVFLRDRFAGAHVYETSFRKAWTAVSFRTNTTELSASTQAGMPSSGIRELTLALPLGGGMMVNDGAGALVAGIGVSGAPGGEADDACAEAGIEAIMDEIAF
jgi:uncharacterized protein GlcG (DUF336 family)